MTTSPRAARNKTTATSKAKSTSPAKAKAKPGKSAPARAKPTPAKAVLASKPSAKKPASKKPAPAARKSAASKPVSKAAAKKSPAKSAPAKTKKVVAKTAPKKILSKKPATAKSRKPLPAKAPTKRPAAAATVASAPAPAPVSASLPIADAPRAPEPASSSRPVPSPAPAHRPENQHPQVRDLYRGAPVQSDQPRPQAQPPRPQGTDQPPRTDRPPQPPRHDQRQDRRPDWRDDRGPRPQQGQPAQHAPNQQQQHRPRHDSGPSQGPRPQQAPGQHSGQPHQGQRRDQRDFRDQRDPRDQRPPQSQPPRPPQDQQPRGDRPPQRPERTHKPKPVLTPEQEIEAQARRDSIFDKTVRFADLGLNEGVLKGITEAGFEFPTAIQAQLIPLILSGKDMLGQAKTGTGKTAAFGLPLLSRIEKGTAFQGLVLVPTRELAIQVATDLRELGRFTGLNILPVYGGQNVGTQAQLLARGPEIIVATPGRVMDMQQRNYLNYRNIKTVVLDEVDRMLDIGFRDDIRRILSSCPRERQTVFVSATINSDIEALARSFARDAEKIVASAGSLTVSMVKQYHLPVQPWDKKQLLLHLLTHEDPALTVVFCRTKKTVDNIAEYLMRKGLDCHAIHGDMYQNKRNKVMEQLRSGKLEVLVASDVASRGLDVEGISHVINYDLPEDPDLYVHRIGRTARAGRDGVAWSLVTPEQGGLLTEIELLINAEIPKLDYPDFKPGPVPADILATQQRQQQRVDTARQFNRFTSPTLPTGGAPAPASAPSQPAAGSATAASGSTPMPPASTAAADATRFPGGIIPTKAPPKRMFGKVKTARSMRSAPPPATPAQPASPAPSAPLAPVDQAPHEGVDVAPEAGEPLANGASNG